MDVQLKRVMKRNSENRYFELDERNERLKYVHTPFEKLSPITQLVGGYQFSIALLENGTLWASGSNKNVLKKRSETYFQINISVPNIESINAFSSKAVISTPLYHLFFGCFFRDKSQKRTLKKYEISSPDLINLNIIEKENKYFTVEDLFIPFTFSGKPATIHYIKKRFIPVPIKVKSDCTLQDLF